MRNEEEEKLTRILNVPHLFNQARFRVYGLVAPVFPALWKESFDLAHVFAGGRVETVSDQHFGVGSNLILPGRGKSFTFDGEISLICALHQERI